MKEIFSRRFMILFLLLSIFSRQFLCLSKIKRKLITLEKQNERLKQKMKRIKNKNSLKSTIKKQSIKGKAINDLINLTSKINKDSRPIDINQNLGAPGKSKKIGRQASLNQSATAISVPNKKVQAGMNQFVSGFSGMMQAMITAMNPTKKHKKKLIKVKKKSKKKRGLFLDSIGGALSSAGPGLAIGGAAMGAGAMAKSQREMEHMAALTRVENDMAASQFGADFGDQAVTMLNQAVGKSNYIDSRLRTLIEIWDRRLRHTIYNFMDLLEQ